MMACRYSHGAQVFPRTEGGAELAVRKARCGGLDNLWRSRRERIRSGAMEGPGEDFEGEGLSPACVVNNAGRLDHLREVLF